MAKNNKKGGVKSAQVNNEHAAEAAAAQVNNGAPAQKSNTSSSDSQATIIGVLHDRFYKDENASEHTGLPQETVDKINEVNAISAAVWMCQEVANGNSKFAATMRIGMLEKIKEIAPTIPGLNIDTTKLLPGKDADTVMVPANAVEITEETKEKLENDAKAQKAAGKTYDVTTMSDNDFKEALSYLMTTHNSENVIDNLNKAVELYREYKKVTDKGNVEKYDNMKPYEIFQEVYNITGDTGLLGSGIGKWAYFVTVSVGTPVPAFCSLRNYAYDQKTNTYKYTDTEIADLIKMLIIYRANVTINGHTDALNKTDKEKNKEDYELHEHAIERAKNVINMMTNCNTEYLDSFVDKAKSTDPKVRNGVHRVVTGVIGSYFGELSKEKVATIKEDSLYNTIKHYIGYITNLFRDPSNQLTDYNLGLAPKFDFKTNEEIEAEVKAAKDAKKAADAAKAKQKEKDAKKAAKATAKAEAKTAAKNATKKLFDQLKLNAHNLLIGLLNCLTFSGLTNKLNNYQSMKNLVTSLLGIAFVVLGCNIANIMGYSPPTNLQTVAASTVMQPMDHFYGQVKDAKPDTVYKDKIVHDTIPCNHKSQSAKTVIKTVIKKTDTSYVPLLYIAEPGVKADSTNYNYTIRKGELCDYKQIISKVCE